MALTLLNSRDYNPGGQSDIMWQDAAGTILIAIPKCGLNSTRGWFESAGPIARYWMNKQEAYELSLLGTPVLLNTRDPAERMVSAWRGHWHKQMPLNAFIDVVTTHTDDELDIHVKSMMSFITTTDGAVIEPTEVIRLRHMLADLEGWKAVHGSYMHRRTSLGYRNASRGPKVRISTTIRNKARERFADDYSYFNLT